MLSLKNPPSLGLKVIFLCLIVVLFTGTDLWVKEIAKEKLEHTGDVVVIPGFWSWRYTQNDDIGFSLLHFLNTLLTAKQKLVLIICLQLTGTCVAIGFYFYLKGWKYSIPLVLIISGGLGNVLARILRGYVIDYVKWYIGSFIWPIFNLADVYTVTGAFSLAIVLFFFSKEMSSLSGKNRKGTVIRLKKKNKTNTSGMELPAEALSRDNENKIPEKSDFNNQ